MEHVNIYEGTPEQLVKHIKRLLHTGRYKMAVTLEDKEVVNVELSAEPELNKMIEQFRKQGLRGVGMFAHVPVGSEEFAKEKQEEIKREDSARLLYPEAE